MNSIYLRRRGKVYVKPGSGGATVGQLAVVQKEAEHLGFVLSERLGEQLRSLSAEQLAQFLRSLLRDLRATTGAHRTHEPLYPGFPQQVLGLSEAQLYLNAISHYLTLRRLPPDENVRPPLLHGKSPREVDLGTLEDFESVFPRLVSSRTALSPQDKEDVAWFVQQYRDDIFRLIPAAIPFKENLAVLGAQLLRHVPGDRTENLLHAHVKTATDVLRLAVALADGDVSLAKPTKFITLKRAQRKLLLGLVERSGEPAEDMRRWAERWKRLGEVLHPGDFAERFPKTWTGFAVLREGLPLQSFNGEVEARLRAGQIDAAGVTLQRRPGEYARRLDHLLRKADSPQPTLDGFTQVAERVSTPVLLQVLSHFRQRSRHQALRAFFPKGDVAKVYAIADARAPLPASAADRVVEACEQALVTRFANLPPLGRCYLDPGLNAYLVPLSQRSASRSLRTLVRGSRLALPDTPVVRLFLWWMNGRGRADIDLSAVLYGTGFNYLDTLAYYNLKNYGGHHSGDIVNAPKGAAEFIDLDLARLREMQVRFVVMVLNSYTEQPYCDLPECFAGWMERQAANTGEVFEPRTVVDRIDVASDSSMCLPLILDLQDQQVVWADIALRGTPRWNNVRNNLSGISLMLRALTSLVKPDLHTLFDLHVQARGERVESPDSADTVFSATTGITPFEIDRIRAEFL